MTVKEYLMQPMLLQKKINELKRKIGILNTTVADISVHLSDMPHAATSNIDSTMNIMCEIMDLKNELGELESRQYNYRTRITLLLSRMPAKYQAGMEILFKRYVEMKVWQDVASEMNICLRAVYKKHEEALRIFSQYLNETNAVCS